jgi:hypothetical protein
MKIYIATSWKNVHAVTMLTEKLRAHGHEILSFVENAHGEQIAYQATAIGGHAIPFDEWCGSDRGKKSFEYDTNAAATADATIYISPAGSDAWAEVGIAWASKKLIFGLHAKGENVGLMRRLIPRWFDDVDELLEDVELYSKFGLPK